VAAAAEQRDQDVDLALAEYEAYAAGKLSAKLDELAVRGGVLEMCGELEDDAALATISYVRASDGAVRPLAVGSKRTVIAELDQIDKHEPLVDEVSPPVAWVDGKARVFAAARGQRLVGVVESDEVVVLLAAAGERLIAVVRSGRGTTTLPLGRPRSVREVDVDLVLRFLGPRAAQAASRARRPSSSTQAHHLRIVAGDRVDMRGGPSVGEVLRVAFEDIAVRAMTRPPRPTAAAGDPGKRKKLRGKTLVRFVLEHLREPALRGVHDLEGRASQILEAIQRDFPGVRLLLGNRRNLHGTTRRVGLGRRPEGSWVGGMTCSA
jgi:hypothetical protein